MAEIFRIVRAQWDMVNSAGQYMGLFLVAFLFLYVVENKKNKVLFAYCLVAILLVFSPFAANNLMSFYLGAGDYWYTFFLFPVIGICAYACVQAVDMQKTKKDQWILFASLIFVAAVAGNLINGNDTQVTADNRAYISQEYLDLFGGMNIEGEPVVLLANDEIMESARAYTQNINLPYEVTLMNQSPDVVSQFYSADLVLAHSQMQEPLNCLGNITTVSRAYQCNYLILPKEADERTAMEAGGFAVQYESENYVLYHDMQMYDRDKQ